MPDPAAAGAAAGSLPTLEQMERDHIARALKACDGHRGKAARMLGTAC